MNLNLKNHLLLCFVFFWGFSAWSQPKLKAGLTLSNVYHSKGSQVVSDAYSWSPGIYAGILGDIRLGDKLKLETGFTYTQKGFLLSEEQNNTKASQRLKLSYLEVPLLLKIVGQNEFGVSPFLVLGGSLSFGILGQVYNEASNIFDSYESYFEMAFGSGYLADLNTVDGIINAGFGFIFQRFQFDVIYSHGLTNILTAKFEGEVLKTRTITIGASYWIKPKH